MLHIDFETRSRVNLLTAGAYNYATDPSTKVLMMAWAIGDGPVSLWLPGQPFPQDVTDEIENGTQVAAFNAQFERLIFWYALCPDHGVPEPDFKQFYCTAAQARANNLPGNLEDCARAVGGKNQKDHRGKALIKIFCIPNAEGTFNDEHSHPEEWAEFCQYCISDTAAERDIAHTIRPLTDTELEDYHVNEYINDRGLMIDFNLADAATGYADEEQANLVARIIELTGGAVKKARGKFITQWVYENLPEEMRSDMHTYKSGERRLTFDKNTRARLMIESDIDQGVMEVIECSDFAQASSTGKFKAMCERADPEDYRVRGSFIFSGASSTGRYSARGLQPHNMPRKGYKPDVADAIRTAMIKEAEPGAVRYISGDNIMQTLKGLLRYSIMAAPGKTFVCGDLAQIEGRVNPWLSMGEGLDWAAREKLDQYATPGVDVYCQTASEILGRPVLPAEPGEDHDPMRQGYGKVPELSLGFGGGVGAFQGMARNYGVRLEHEVVQRIVKSWRASNPWAEPFWHALHRAAVDAVRYPGNIIPAGRVSYLYQDDYMHGTLWCLLPSGRLLSYPKARAVWKENKFGRMAWELTAMKAAWKPKADETEWPRNYLWGGLLCENITQAAAADILRESLAFLVTEIDAPVVGHTHDEALLEVDEATSSDWSEKLFDAMVTNPEWADELPLDADVWTGPRYRK